MMHMKPSHILSLVLEVPLCIVNKDMLRSAHLSAVAMQVTDL